MTIKIEDITDHTGIIISNFDASRDVNDEKILQIRELIQKKHFLCFRNQNLNEDTLLNFARQFGTLESYPEKDKTKKNVQIFNVANVSSEGDHLSEDDPRVVLQKNNSRWHTDSSYRFYPALFSLLYGKEILPKEAAGGQTQFCNMILAYNDLPKDMKEKLQPLHQVHSYNDIRRLEPSLPELSIEEKQGFPPVTHPLIRIHPDRNMTKSLFFTSNTSLEIGGMSFKEGKELHSWLVNYIDNKKFHLTHDWQINDLIMWDNRVLLHRVIPYDYSKYRRAMIRGTVEGTTPVYGPFSQIN